MTMLFLNTNGNLKEFMGQQMQDTLAREKVMRKAS